MKKILSILTICILSVGLFCLAGCKTKSEPTSVMTMQVNPSVQFVLDQNNKVVSATGINEDGQNLVLMVDFKGKTAEEASKLFVKVATELGKIDVSTSGTTVNIAISTKDESTKKIENLKNSVTKTVNQYFKDNGIIAGAKVKLGELFDEVKMFGEQVRYFAGQTKEEALEYLMEISKELENIEYSSREALNTAIANVNDSFKATIEPLKETINDLYNSLNGLIENETMKKEIQTRLENEKKRLEKLEKQVQEQIDVAVDNMETKCQAAISKLKANLNAIITAGNEVIENHKQAFEADKNAILELINSYQNDLA